MKTLHKIIIGDSRQMKEVLYHMEGVADTGKKTETIVPELPKG